MEPKQLIHFYFYPRPPRGGRQWPVQGCARQAGISIHALREEGDEGEILYALAIAISIHALREEGDKAAP